MRINNGDGFVEHKASEPEIIRKLQELRDQGRIHSYERHSSDVAGTIWEVRQPNFGTIMAMTTNEVVAFIIGTGGKA